MIDKLNVCPRCVGKIVLQISYDAYDYFYLDKDGQCNYDKKIEPHEWREDGHHGETYYYFCEKCDAALNCRENDDGIIVGWEVHK